MASTQTVQAQAATSSSQQQQQQSSTYTISTLPAAVANLTITTYRIVATKRDSGDCWSIQLLHKNGVVQLNMVSKPGNSSQLQITSSKCHSRPQGRWWDIDAYHSRSVHEILGMITNRGRERYEMYAAGTGGRYWVKTVMYDLADMRFTTELSTDYTTIQQIMPKEKSDAQEGRFF